MFFDGDDEILVVGYLSAVAGALDERGVAVTTLRLGPRPGALSGTLGLHPAGTRPGLGWGPTQVSWDEQTGWSAELCGGIDGGFARRYLNADLVASPTTVAGFVAALATGQDVGVLAPAWFPDGAPRQLITQLGRFAVPEPW